MFEWFEKFTPADLDLACSIIGSVRPPDLVIAPDGKPYLYRWHLLPRTKQANVYFHIQVDSDPERPLHDHPWDNFSVILRGGYDEILCREPGLVNRISPTALTIRKLRQGMTCYRKATGAHRLILPPEFPYTMTLFSTGPVVREWGFWFPEGWINADDVTIMEGKTSVMKDRCRADLG